MGETPMRVLTIANTPLDQHHGSGYVVLNYAEGLRRRGHEVTLLGPPDYEPWHGVSRGIRHRQSLGMLWAAAKRMKAGAFDVLELYGGEAWLTALALTRLPGRRFIVVAHSNGLETHCSTRLAQARRAGVVPRRGLHEVDLNWAHARGFKAVDAVVTVSEFDGEYARREAYGGYGVLAIENPLPTEYLGRAVQVEREPRVGFVGSWLPRKGVGRIAAEMPAVLREFPNWRLTLVGVGEGFDPGRYFPRDVLPRIDVVPHTDRATLLTAHYPRFAIALLPSIYESFGLAAAEAMACGAALVASPVGFAHALRDGIEAVLAPWEDAASLSAAVRRLIRDESLRRAVARGGQARVQALTWRTAVDRLESAYLGWLAAHRREANPENSGSR